MAVDESSSQDSTLIDDDLVAALGFEPVSSVDERIDDVVATSERDLPNGDTLVSSDDIDVLDEADGAGVEDGIADLLDDAPVDDIDPELAVTDLETPDLDVDEVDVADDAVEVLEDAELLVVDDDALANEHETVDEIGEVDETPEASESVAATSFFDLDGGDAADAEADVSVDDTDGLPIEAEVPDDIDVAAVPSIADDEDLGDATAPVDLVTAEPDASAHADDDADDADADDAGYAVIDLDVLDVSDSPLPPVADAAAPDTLLDPEVPGLADADSVFADATPAVDAPPFGEPDQITETVNLVDAGSLETGGFDAGSLDLDTAGAATAATATAATADAKRTKRRRRLRARKSRRVIRHIDPWSVLTFSVLFHMVVFAALLLSSVLVWNAAIASGMVENVESFIQELGDYETFEINADVMFQAAVVIAGMLTLASSVLVVLLTVVFNLISDIVGGIRVTVIEEETVRVPIEKKRSKAKNE